MRGLACAGNILDFGIFADLDLSFAMKTVKTAFTKPIATDAVQILQKKMDSII